MAYDEGLAQRLRERFDELGIAAVEKKMFGGLCFMVRGHMTCGITGEDLMLRVGKDQYAEAVEQPGAREMDFTGKALKGFVYLGADAYEADEALEGWVERTLVFNRTLAPK